MSLMPNEASLVRLTDGRIAIVTKVTPKGDGDKVWTGQTEESVTAWDIAKVIHEPELKP